MTEYTPTTEEVRFKYTGPDGVAGSEFDRWLVEHDRQVAAKAYEKGGGTTVTRRGRAMKLPSIEAYWSEELGETVEITPVGWANCPTEFALYVGGTHVVAFKRLEEVEDYLSRYFVLKGA